MSIPERNETTVVHTGGGGAGWFVAILLLLLVVGGGFFAYQSGMFAGAGSNDLNVTIDVPDLPAPAPAE